MLDHHLWPTSSSVGDGHRRGEWAIPPLCPTPHLSPFPVQKARIWQAVTDGVITEEESRQKWHLCSATHLSPLHRGSNDVLPLYSQLGAGMDEGSGQYQFFIYHHSGTWSSEHINGPVWKKKAAVPPLTSRFLICHHICNEIHPPCSCTHLIIGLAEEGKWAILQSYFLFGRHSQVQAAQRW